MLAWSLLVAALFGASGSAGVYDEHVFDVPYRSQLDGSRYALANCGPTALAMALAYYGIEASPWELRVRSMQAQHSWITDEGGYSDRYGVFVYNLATAAESLGAHANGLWLRDGWRLDRLHEWRPVEIRREIEAERPVILQVKYRALPEHASSLAPDDHYIVVHGLRGSRLVYSDPMGIDDGASERTISEADLVVAMARATTPSAGFAVGRGRV